MITDSAAQALAIVITAIGGPTLLLSLGRTIFKWWTGRSGRERQHNRDIIDDLRSTEGRADDEAVLRRNALDYASELRLQLTEAGIRPLPWPDGMNHRRSKSRPTE